MDNLDEETILVLDSLAGSITEFTMTDYGRMINEALRLYKIGSYDESAEVWKRILQYNGNLELAYIGIGRALLRTDNYEEAMRYFENAHDSENYSKAYQHYREQVVEKYIIYFVVAIALLIIIPKVVRRVRKLRKEIREA
jgi:tetratricopeptide (TPR) repeat protein